MLSRFLIVTPVALAITVALFLLMRYLIATPPGEQQFFETPRIEIGRTIEDTESKPRNRFVEPPMEPPPQAKKPNHDEVRRKIPTTPIPNPGPPVVDPPGEFALGMADGGATPIIRPKLEYPGCGRGTGKVVLEYVVEPSGTVTDVRVVSATSSCFATAAKRATRQWYYRPKVVNGEPVRSEHLRVTLEFYPE